MVAPTEAPWMTEQRTRRTRAARRAQPLPYVYLAPALGVLAVFGLLPVLFTVAISLCRWDSMDGLAGIRFAGVDNFVWVFVTDDWFGGALMNQLWHTVVSGALIHATAIPLAAFIDQAFRRFRATLLALYFLPFLTAGIVVYIILQTLFSSSEHGLVNAGLLALGNVRVLGLRPLALFFPVEPIQFFRDHGDGIRVMATWWHEVGWNVLLYVTALQTVPRILLEAARVDGANAWQTLRHVTVPQLRPMIFFAGSLTVIWGVSAGGRRTLAGYMQFMAYDQGDYGAAAAMSVVVLAVLAGLVYFLWSQVGGRPALPRTPVPGAALDDHPPRITLGGRAMAWLRRTLAAPESRDPANLRGFDGMRAIACLLVIFHHLSQRLDGDWALVWWLKPVWILGLRMDMGVCIFLVLSGALLSMPYWQRFLDGARPPPLGDYALRRAARIVPGYWAALAASTLVGLWAIPEAQAVLPRFLAGATFTSGLHWVTLFPSELDPVLWSISFEVMCYLLLPLLVLPMWRALPDRAPRRALRYVLGVLVGLELAHLAIVANFMTAEEGKGWRYGLLGGAKEWLPYWSPASFMTMFMLGGAAALGVAWKQRVNPKRSTDWDRLGTWSLLAGWLLYALFGSGVNSVTRQPYITPVFPALVAFGLFAMQFGDRLPRWLDNRLLAWVAKHSFGLYLWHFPVLELLRITWVPRFKPMELRSIPMWLLLSTIAVAASALLAWLSWNVLEQPALRWARGRRRPAPALSPEVAP
jgi:peptidoglycan/LPS O-acetylase OafA/YrhL/ABC-type sugar transport system permease subunit